MYEDAHRAVYGVEKACQAARLVASRTTPAAIWCRAGEGSPAM
jgi:hypothetical protein